MAQVERQQTVLNILQNLRGLDGLKKLFWEELNYERENKPLSPRQWPDSAKQTLAEDPILFASGGEQNAFHVVYCRLASPDLRRGFQRPVVNQLLRDHPYALFVFSNKNQSAWHFLNVKYDETLEKRRLIRRITVLPGGGLRTAAERLQILDLKPDKQHDFTNIPPLKVQELCDLAFDVEKVTKEFYREIANWYFWALKHAKFPKDAPVDADGKPSLPLIRLLTRLIFCWFLKEKRNPRTGVGLIPNSLFDARCVKDLLKDPSPEACTYYTAILQNLFFATLNTEMDTAKGNGTGTPGIVPARRFLNEGDGQRSDEHMVHQFWRHARQLRDASALEKLLRDIPFLNGGLFECLDDRVQKGNSPYTIEVRIDGFATDPKKQPTLPNFLFYGAPQEADLSAAYGDIARRCETVRPLLDILSRYNFTLTENTPFDQEVALDPELLGHVFENLLAAFNPETGTVARKATGSFYTPRVVVDWMVDQALLVYLKDTLTTEDAGKRLKRLLSWEDDSHDFKPAEVEKLIDAIDGLKAIDPACGSGAFPMGMLQKLVHVLKKLDPENKGWRKRQADAAAKIESGPAREEALKAIERAFARDNDDYGRKLYLIENCLYGVDIQPIAVQIAKLRFFISLVVDQSIDPKEANYGILPLPNLETKVVAANTLLGLYRGQLLLGSNEVKRLETELQKVRHDYFTARSYKRKKELRKEDKRLCDELATALESSGECTPYDAKRMVGWNPYDTNTHAPFFDPGWMFGLASKNHDGVFDVVIGNPPYVRQEELKNQTVIGSDGKPQPLKDALKGQYECFTGTADLFVYFFERSLQLLCTGGVLSFITSNKWFRAGYGERLRTYLAYATQPSVVLDFGDAPVFTSIAYPAILVTQKTRSVELGKLPKNVEAEDWQSRVMTWTPGPDIREFTDIFERDAFALAQRDLKPDGWRMENPVSLRLLERLRKAGTPLGEYVKGRFYYGIKTGLNEAFVVDRANRDRLIVEHSSSKEVLKPFLRGRDVKRWRCEYADQYLIKIESSENKTHPWSGKPEKEAERVFAKIYPAIHEFFNDKDRREALIKRYDQGKYFWELRSCNYWQEFEQPKVVFPDIAPSAQFAWDEMNHYLVNTSYILIAPSWMLSVLNSTAVLWFYKNTSNAIRGGYLRYIRQYVEQIPIPPATPAQQALCERLVEALIWLHRPEAKKAKDAPTGLMIICFEQWLNGLVYELFFPGELHARKLKLFDETAKLNPPDLAKLSDSRKLTALRELHAKAYDRDATLRAMLVDLKSLDVVRVIGDVDTATGNQEPEAGE
ncbi:MAG: TaqI-like C-terminal specificity domain-containing protein [Chlamydiota bacterium]